MLALAPQSVTLFGAPLADVDALAIDRRSSKQTEERTDLGPHLVFADVPEQRVTVSITRTLTRDEASTLRPGQQGELRFTVSPSDSDARRRTFVATVVLLSIDHDLSTRAGAAAGAGARQRIHAVALSTDGASDPIAESVSNPQ